MGLSSFVEKMSVGSFLRSFDLPSDEEEDPVRRCVHYDEADIYLAARIGDTARVKYLVEQEGVDVNKRDFWDSVPLYYACLTGHCEVVKLLLEKGAICNENTFDGDRCLYGALTLEIRELLEQGDVNKTPPLKPLARSIRRLCSLCDDPEQTIPDSLPFQSLCDLELNLGDQVYRVNKAILAARLRKFDEILTLDVCRKMMAVNGGGEVVWEALLIYVYSEKLDLEMKDVKHLRKLAKHYGCPALVKMTEKELLSIKYYFKTLKKKAAPKRFVLYPYSFPEEASLEHDLRLLRQRSQILEEAMMKEQEILAGQKNDYADILLQVDGVQFRVHGCILCCRSDYFYQRILLNAKHGFTEPPTMQCPLFGQLLSILVLIDVQSSTLKVVLEYMYTETVDSLSEGDLEDFEMMSDLFQLANRLLVFGMKRRIAERLKKMKWSLPEICELLILADFNDCALLRDFCLQKVAGMLDDILVMEEDSELRDYFESFVSEVAPEDIKDAEQLFDSSATKGDFHGVIDGTHVGGIGSNSILEDLREKYLEISGWDEDERDNNARQFDQAFLKFTLNARQKHTALQR